MIEKILRFFGICLHDWRPIETELSESIWTIGIKCRKCGEMRVFK